MVAPWVRWPRHLARFTNPRSFDTCAGRHFMPLWKLAEETSEDGTGGKVVSRLMPDMVVTEERYVSSTLPRPISRSDSRKVCTRRLNGDGADVRADFRAVWMGECDGLPKLLATEYMDGDTAPTSLSLDASMAARTSWASLFCSRIALDRAK